MSVTEAVTSAFADITPSPLTAIAFALAARLDDPDEKSPAPVAKQLMATLAAVAEVGAEKEQAVDPLAVARAKRAARKSATKAV